MFKIQVIGNIGGDPEVKTTKSGRDYLAFSVAHDRGQNNAALWVRVCWFDGIGHRLQQYIRRGAKLCVYGDATVEAYIDNRTGQPTVGLTVYPDSVYIVLFPKREDDMPAGGPAPAYQAQPAAGGQAYQGRPVSGAARRPIPGEVPANTPPSWAPNGAPAPSQQYRGSHAVQQPGQDGYMRVRRQPTAGPIPPPVGEAPGDPNYEYVPNEFVTEDDMPAD